MFGGTMGPHETYKLTPEQIHTYNTQGFVLLPKVISSSELAEQIEPVYYKFLRGEISVAGKDLCDMSGASGRNPEQYTIYNVMLPRLYYPPWQGNVLEQKCLVVSMHLQTLWPLPFVASTHRSDMRAWAAYININAAGREHVVGKDLIWTQTTGPYPQHSIARQLLGDDMELDFDQLLAKRPHSTDSVMAWHQDAAYWPPLKSDTTTANCWVAVTDAPVEAGCMRYIPGSHKEPALRQHVPVSGSREESHAIHIPLDESQEDVRYIPMQKGDVLVHHERVVHGSGPNTWDQWRCAYVLNFKKRACIKEERSLGFTHSHNDEINWDKFIV